MTEPIHKMIVEHGWNTVPGVPLHVAEQRDRPALWYLATGVEHRVIIGVTGQDTPDDADYLCTFLADGGHFVGHVYVRAPKERSR